MPRSVEFLIHYRCAKCQEGFARGDRLPMEVWTCPSCLSTNTDSVTTLHLNLMSTGQQLAFANLLKLWANQIIDTHKLADWMEQLQPQDHEQP